MRASLRGEQDAETLYAYKRAGAPVHDLLDAAERRRFGMAASGQSPFGMPRQLGLELACTWNAFALQTLGDKMLEADEQADPGTVGFVPPVTFQQVQSYYAEVQRWLAHASRAEHDPDFRLPRGSLPARLPDWSPVEPCPRPHLDALVAALRAMQLHLESAMHALEQHTPEADAPRLARLRGLFAEALAGASYALGMYAPQASAALHEQVEALAKRAVENIYRVGQLVSDPALLDAEPAAREAPPAPRRAALPGEVGFDPWVMTTPLHVDMLRRDPNAARVIHEMWALDPHPAESLRLWQDIQDAVQRGAARLARQPGGQPVGHYFCTPYAAIYEAVRPVVIGDTPVRAGQRFTLECAAEGVRLGYPFKREVVIANFSPAQIDYCDPDAPPPHE